MSLTGELQSAEESNSMTRSLSLNAPFVNITISSIMSAILTQAKHQQVRSEMLKNRTPQCDMTAIMPTTKSSSSRAAYTTPRAREDDCCSNSSCAHGMHLTGSTSSPASLTSYLLCPAAALQARVTIVISDVIKIKLRFFVAQIFLTQHLY